MLARLVADVTFSLSILRNNGAENDLFTVLRVREGK